MRLVLIGVARIKPNADGEEAIPVDNWATEPDNQPNPVVDVLKSLGNACVLASDG